MNTDDFAACLIAWHGRYGRKHLPWQQNPTAYRVWISEIMLQQTQVATVIPYYHRFIASFPDVLQLAKAKLDDVLHHWSGLGYYARARNLHRAACLIRERHAGCVPESFEALIALPGIGRSTAGAVLSLALGQRHPILDGNVKRVLTRCFALAGWPGEAAVERRLWRLAERLTPVQQVATYNQALMDLGASVCTRTNPTCGVCPLNTRCQGFAMGEPSRYPATKPRKSVPLRQVRMLLLYREEGVLLLEKRPPSGIWGGLWSLPECALERDPADFCTTHLGVQVEALYPLPQRRHTFTHFQLEIHPLAARIKNCVDSVLDGSDRLWYNTAQPDRLGMAAPVARIIGAYRALTTGDNV
ncbi:MAG: A/G-specific adenine glycosylase [Gammaproteobacteria bacterium]|nr:A/G-specific adenine glycosylase [Gammaproteobacteria bacterium]